MKIFKSIKWRLQIWYGLILVVVLAGFGFTAYQLERNRQFRRIDDELHRRIDFLAKGLHRPPPQRGPDGNRPPMDQPPRGPNGGGGQFGQPPPERLPDDGPPQQDQQDMLDYLSTPQARALFNNDDPNQFNFVIHPRGGAEVGNSPQHQAGWWNTEMVVNDHHATSIVFSNLTPELGDLGAPQTLGEFRGIVRKLPSGEAIQVSCTIAPELKVLRRTALTLIGVGGLILLIGLAGGGWLVTHAPVYAWERFGGPSKPAIFRHCPCPLPSIT